KRLAERARGGGGLAHIRQADRLTAAAVARDCEEHRRNALSLALEKGAQLRHVHVSLERMTVAGIGSLWNRQVDRFRAARLDVAARGVEVRVRRHDATWTADDREQNRLGRTTLMRRDDVAERHEVLHRRREAEVGRRTRIRLVA